MSVRVREERGVQLEVLRQLARPHGRRPRPPAGARGRAPSGRGRPSVAARRGRARPPRGGSPRRRDAGGGRRRRAASAARRSWWGLAGRSTRRRGRAARSGWAGRLRGTLLAPRGARGAPPQGPGPASGGASCDAPPRLERLAGPPVRARAASHSSRAQSRRPRATSSAVSRSWISRRWATSAAASSQLPGPERSRQPVGEAVALREVDPRLALGQGAQRRRAVADEPGGDLGVEVRRGPSRTPARGPRGPGRPRGTPRSPHRRGSGRGAPRPRGGRRGRARRPRRSGGAPASGSRCAPGGTRCRGPA